MTPPESFIQFLWMNKIIPAIGLKNNSGENIQILNFGQLNKIAGPDIFNARVKIGETLWNGNVEFHTKSSEWYNHKHHLDKAYDNVILHVVLEDDKPVELNGNLLDTLTVPPSIVQEYLHKIDKEIVSNPKVNLPCSKLLAEIPSVYIENWKTRLLLDRIEKKLSEFDSKLDIQNYTWATIFSAFGVKYNKVPMQQLATQIDFRELYSYSKIELDNYFMKISQLELPISINSNNLIQTEIPQGKTGQMNIEWKFGGIRPANQPIVKLMQFSSFFFLTKENIVNLLIKLDFNKILNHIDQISIHTYWETHSAFNRKCKSRKLIPGKSFKNHLLLNAFYPLGFILNKRMNKTEVSDHIVECYEKTTKEKNRIVKFMVENGFENKNGFDSQALIHLNHYYCQNKRCLNCEIGIRIIK